MDIQGFEDLEEAVQLLRETAQRVQSGMLL